MDIFELSYVGSPKGLMSYLTGICAFCLVDGFVMKTEWSGTDDSFEVEVPCICQD